MKNIFSKNECDEKVIDLKKIERREKLKKFGKKALYVAGDVTLYTIGAALGVITGSYIYDNKLK